MRNVKNEINQLITLTGAHTEKFLFICLLEQISYPEILQAVKDGSQISQAQTKNTLNSQIKIQFLTNQLQQSSQEQYFVNYFADVLEQMIPFYQNQLVKTPDENTIISLKDLNNNLQKYLKVPLQVKFVISLSFCSHYNQEVQKIGYSQLKSNLQEYFQMGKPIVFSESILSNILYILKSNKEFQDCKEEIRFFKESTQQTDKLQFLKPLQTLELGEDDYYLQLEPINISSINPNQKQEFHQFKKVRRCLKLSDMLEELLQGSMAQYNNLTSLFQEFSPISEDEIVDCLIVIANNSQVLEDANLRTTNQIFQAVRTGDWSKFEPDDYADKKTVNWNVDFFIKACIDHIPGLKWQEIIKKLDTPKLKFKDSKSFQYFMKFFQRVRKTIAFNFPQEIIFKQWKNTEQQINFINYVIESQNLDLIFWNELQKRMANTDFDPNFKIFSLQPPILQIWGCLDFIELMLNISSRGSDIYLKVRQLFNIPIQQQPQMITIGLAQITSQDNNGSPLLDELFSQLIPLQLLNHVNSMQILEHLWKINQPLMISAICEMYTKENSSLNLSRVLDISQEIKDSMISLVNCSDMKFSVSLGILAGKRDFLHFDQWLSERINNIGNKFIHHLLQYINEHVIVQCQQLGSNTMNSSQNDNDKDNSLSQLPQGATPYERILDKAQLSIEFLGIIFENLIVNHNDKLDQRNLILLQQLYRETCQYFPQLSNNSSNQSVEIEAAANQIFQQIYKEEITIAQGIEHMNMLKQSQNSQEKEIFACIISNLFDEYRFHEQYPPKELHITGVLFGAIINSGLIEGFTLNIAIKCVQESLEKKNNGKRFEFGIKALQQFKNRIHEFPQLCQALFQIEILKEKHFDLLEEIKQRCDQHNIDIEYPVDLQGRLSKNGVSGFQKQQENLLYQNPNRMQQMSMNQPQQQVNINQQLLNLPQMNSQQSQQSQSQQQFGNNFVQQRSNNPLQPSSLGDQKMSQQQLFQLQQQIQQQIQQQQLLIQQNQNNPQFQQNNQLALQRLLDIQKDIQIQLQQQQIPLQSQNDLLQQQQSIQSQIQINQTGQEVSKAYICQHPQFENKIKEEDLEKQVSEQIKTKVTFCLNNLTKDNVSEKCQEIKSVLGNEDIALQWFSWILVVKRAASESSVTQQNYIILLQLLNKKNLYNYVLRDTYFYLQKIVTQAAKDKTAETQKDQKSEFSQQQSSQFSNERTTLKNLGTWLGQITLARNKPIVRKYLNIKSLICDAYFNNKLHTVIPLVCRILEGAKNSEVFKQTNPWLNSLLTLLAELNTVAEVKASVKCEIQILFKNLSISLEQMQPANQLQLSRQNGTALTRSFVSLSNPQQVFVQPQNLAQNSMNNYPQQSSQQQQYLMQLNQQKQQQQMQQQRLNQQAQNSQVRISSLAEHIVIDQKTLGQYLQKGLNLKMLVAQAVENSINDIIKPVISRSVTIAIITTRELALKDFALEADENKLLRGTSLIVQSLSGSLAQVTSREPLKLSLNNYLKQLLDENAPDLDEQDKNAIIQTATQDNLDLGCNLIKNAVISKALEDVNQDAIIKDAVEKRRLARERGEQYRDEKALSQIPPYVPASIRPNSYVYNFGQNVNMIDYIKIYEDFSRKQQAQQQQIQFQQRQQGIDFYTFFQKLDQSLDTINQQNVDLVQLLQWSLEILQYQYFDDIANDIFNIIFQYLFLKLNNSKKIIFYIEYINQIKEKSKPETANKLILSLKQSITNVIHENIGDRYNHWTISKILRTKIISPLELDQLIVMIFKRSPMNIGSQIMFTRILKCLIFEEKICTPLDFIQSLEAIKFIIQQNVNQIQVENQTPKEVKEFILSLENQQYQQLPVQGGTNNNFMVQGMDMDNKIDEQPVQQISKDMKAMIQLVEQIFGQGNLDMEYYQSSIKLFSEWLQIQTDNQIGTFIKSFQNSDQFQSGPQNLTKFFSYVIDYSVARAMHSIQKHQQDVNNLDVIDYSYIDQFTKLCIILLKTLVSIEKKIEILDRILESISIVLTKYYMKMKKEFNQRPFFKLFYNLIFDFKRTQYQFKDEEIYEFFQNFIKHFVHLSPLNYIGFSFAWLELISNKYFLPTILRNQQLWFEYHRLLMELFRFFNNIMTDKNQSSKLIQTYYKGTLRVLLILLHDFPEFLSEYAHQFCDEIPNQFTQVKNIILAAFPNNLRPPDPFQVASLDIIDEFKQLPQLYCNDFESKIVKLNLHNDINNYLNTKNEVDYRNICSKLVMKTADNKTQINTSVVNAFVIAIPWMIYAQYEGKLIDTQKFYDLRTESYSLFAKLLKQSNPAMKDAILNATINQIRYPNLITHYFINFIFLIFLEMDNENIQEQITRILVERLIIERPHPWGVMYTFIELIRNQKFNFKKKSYFQQYQIYDDILKHVFKQLHSQSESDQSQQSQ